MATQGGVVNNRREIIVAPGAGVLALQAPPPRCQSARQGRPYRHHPQSLLLRVDEIIQ